MLDRPRKGWNVDFLPKKIVVTNAGNTILNEEWESSVCFDDGGWFLVDDHIHISVDKIDTSSWWSRAFKSEQKMDVKKLQPENSSVFLFGFFCSICSE